MRRLSGRLGWWVAAALATVLVGGGLARRAGYLGSGVVYVRNELIEPVELLRNGAPADTVPPAATARLRLDGGELRWRLLRPGNPPIGEALEGPLPPLQRVRGRRLATVTAVGNGQAYFAPLITNTSSSDITLEVNPGSAAAVRCNCLVPKGAARTHIGYYRLYQNSSVAAYNTAHPYFGPHVDRESFATRVGPQSGAVVLTF